MAEYFDEISGKRKRKRGPDVTGHMGSSDYLDHTDMPDIGPSDSYTDRLGSKRRRRK